MPFAQVTFWHHSCHMFFFPAWLKLLCYLHVLIGWWQKLCLLWLDRLREVVMSRKLSIERGCNRLKRVKVIICIFAAEKNQWNWQDQSPSGQIWNEVSRKSQLVSLPCALPRRSSTRNPLSALEISTYSNYKWPMIKFSWFVIFLDNKTQSDIR